MVNGVKKPQQKVCGMCNQPKDASQFQTTTAHTSEDGLLEWCLECDEERDRITRHLSREVTLSKKRQRAYIKNKKTRRYCEVDGCGARLSYDNKTSMCGPCRRKKILAGSELQTIKEAKKEILAGGVAA